MIVVSNREPYSHDFGDNGAIEVQVPASGMVTALEPVMRACSGTWVAHGSGTADRETVDRSDRVRVPPDDPSYTLRRVWLSEAEEQGFYYGLSNEGLWPLCHLAYVRPAFRGEDWVVYQAVNRKFAEIVAQEAQSDRPGDPDPGLSLRAAAGLPARAPTEGDHRAVLAHTRGPTPRPSASARGSARCCRTC